MIDKDLEHQLVRGFLLSHYFDSVDVMDVPIEEYVCQEGFP